MSGNDDALWDQLLDNLPVLKPFKKLGVEARAFSPGEEIPLGELPGKYRGTFLSNFKKSGVFVIYSKGNPVAWRGLGKRGHWAVPYDVRYDKVALEHQRLIRHALKP